MAPREPMPHMEVDHVSIAVPRIGEALAFFRRHFPVEMGVATRPGYTPDFNWCDFYLGRFKLELIEPVGDDSFVRRFLSKRGPGMHHWSIEVDRLGPLLDRMEGDGVRVVDRFDTGAHMTAFISPRSAHGVLVQFWQVPHSAKPERPAVVPHTLRSGEVVHLCVDHVSIAVHDIAATVSFFGRYLPIQLGRPPHRGWDGTFLLTNFKLNGYKVEVIQNAPDHAGFVQRFIERRGEGLHHISIDVDRLDPYVAQLEADGVRVVDKTDLGGGRKTAFISPRSAYGVLIQLWQEPGLDAA